MDSNGSRSHLFQAQAQLEAIHAWTGSPAKIGRTEKRPGLGQGCSFRMLAAGCQHLRLTRSYPRMGKGRGFGRFQLVKRGHGVAQVSVCPGRSRSAEEERSSRRLRPPVWDESGNLGSVGKLFGFDMFWRSIMTCRHAFV